MALYDDLIAAIPELKDSDFVPSSGTILLQNDGDKAGDYIAKWDYPTALPTGFKLGK